MRDLKPEDIKVGALIWYHGETYMSAWDCPAEIVEVNLEEGWFRVRSLDDLKVQDQKYDFLIDQHTPASRKNMRIPDTDKVVEFLQKQRRGIADAIQEKQDEIVNLQRDLGRFEATLNRIEVMA